MSEYLVSTSSVYNNNFEYEHGKVTYWLRKGDNNELKLYEENNLHSGHTRKNTTFEHVWALMLTEEPDTRLHTTYHLVKVIYGGGIHREFQGHESVSESAPFSNVKMQTKSLFRVSANDWLQLVTNLETWAAHKSFNLVHDYKRHEKQ